MLPRTRRICGTILFLSALLLFSVRVVAAAPSITSLTPNSGAVGASVTIAGSGFGSTQGSSSVKFNGTTATVTSWSATSVAVIVPTGATTGNVVVTVSGVASNGKSFTVLPTPSITSLSPSSGAVGASVTIAGSNFGATQGSGTVKFNGTTATVTSWSASSIGVTVPSGATTGNAVVHASGVDSNGKTFTVLPAPSITSLSPSSGATGTPVTISGANFGSTQGSSTVRFNGATATVTSWSAGSISAAVPSGASTGNVVVHASGVDSNGASFTVLFPPDIISVSPAVAAAGTSVTISGSDFGASQGASTVTFNGAIATPTAWSATQITVPVPGAATTGNIVVHVGGLDSNFAAFTVLPTPAISSVSPTSGAVGSTIQVSGVNFGSTQGSSTIALNGLAINVTTWSPTNIVGTVPTGAATGNVVVTVAGVSSNSVNYTVTTTPAIFSLSPTAGPAGTSVTITGANFGSTQGTSTVTFNGTVATATSWTGTSIVAPVPTGSTSGPVKVTVSGNASNGVPFATPGAPNISSLSPTAGLVGTSVTITGTDFGATQGASTVTFKTTAAAPTSWSPTQIIVPVPSGANSGNVTVTASGITGSAVFFTVITTPFISSISPSAATPGTSVTITGANFGPSQGTSTVTFNGIAVTPTSWSPTSIGVTLPGGNLTGNVIVAVSQTASNAVKFSTIPLITNLSPTSGIIGNSITITGVGLSAAGRRPVVDFSPFFAGDSCFAFPTSTSDTAFVVSVPSCAVTGPVKVEYQDANFNQFQSNGILFTVNPSISSLSPTSGTVGTSVQINGGPFGFPQGTGTVTFNGTPATPTSWSLNQIVAFPPVGSTSGNVVVTVGGQATNPAAFTLNPSPVLSSVSPATGAAGTSVTIAGSGFGTSQGATTVTFSGTTATPTSWSPGSIVVPVPAAASTGNVVVTYSSGAASNGINFTVISPPSISFLSTTTGSVGRSVSIFGSNFGNTQGTSQITFNGTAATATLWNPSEIDVLVPSGATTGNVVVTIPSLPASNGVTFTVVPRATISSLSPTSGQAGLPVTITGTNFGSAVGSNTVTFNGTTATLTSATSTSIAVTVPEGATSGNVVVTTPNGPSIGVSFSVIAGPGITSVSPAKGGVGATVTITGAAFGQTQGTSSVKFNNIVATPSSWSDTGIVVPVPNGATTGNVVVAVGGTSSNGVSFTVSAGLSVTAVSPVSGNTGDSVTITGTGFGATQGSSTVTFNGAKATISAWTNTSITASVPASATSGPVVVTVGGALSDGINFTATPEITGISPNPAALGAIVTITGANFGATQGISIVTCNGASNPVTSWSSSSIVLSQCVTNFGSSSAITISVQVTVSGVSSDVVAIAGIPDPSLSTATPMSAAVGTPILIRGKNLGATQGQSSVIINGAAATPTSWSDTAIIATVPSGAAAIGFIDVVVGGHDSNPMISGFTVGALSVPNSLQISPASVNMLIGDTKQFNVVDESGLVRFDATWTVDNTSLGTITTTISPTVGNSAVLTAVAAGTVTLTATVQGVSAHMPVTISGATSFPAGTILWSAPAVAGFSASQIVQAAPTDFGPDLYSVQKSSDGTQTLLQAFTADGQLMSQSLLLGALTGNAVPDAYGGLIGIAACDPANPSTTPMAISDFGDAAGWSIQIVSGAGLCPSGPPKIAIRQDGAVVIAGPLQTANPLLVVDGQSGSVLLAPAIPPSTLINSLGQSSSCDCFTPVGQPMVDSDGSTYVEYEVRQLDSRGATSTSSILWLLKIAPDGTTSTTQLSASNNANLFPGNIIPDGQGGVLATWTVDVPFGPPAPHLYQAAHVSSVGMNTYDLPMAPMQLVIDANTGLPINPPLVLGENGTAFVSYATNVTSFDLNAGSANWNYQAPPQTSASIITSIDGGGVAINNSQQGVFQLDASGAATQVISGNVFSQPTFSWTGEWHADSVSSSTASAVVMPLVVDAASLWTTPSGNPSESAFASPLDPSSFQSTDPPPPSTICPTCQLQSPNCLTMAGLQPTYLILVGDRGQNFGPGHNHNLMDLLSLAAQQKANDLNKQGTGNWVAVCRVSSVQDFEAALTEVAPGEVIPGQITGGVFYYGHGAYIPDVLGGMLVNEHSILAPGDGTGADTNISDSNVNQLLNTELGPNATITLNGCNAGAPTPGYHRPPIALLLAQQLKRPVFAYDVGIYFSHEDADHDSHFNGLDIVNGNVVVRKVSWGLPMYAVPEGIPGRKPKLKQFPAR